jgi:hypothetical protein
MRPINVTRRRSVDGPDATLSALHEPASLPPAENRGDAIGHQALLRYIRRRTMAEVYVYAPPLWPMGLPGYHRIARFSGRLDHPRTVGDGPCCLRVSGSTDVTGSQYQA